MKGARDSIDYSSVLVLLWYVWSCDLTSGLTNTLWPSKTHAIFIAYSASLQVSRDDCRGGPIISAMRRHDISIRPKQMTQTTYIIQFSSDFLRQVEEKSCERFSLGSMIGPLNPSLSIPFPIPPMTPDFVYCDGAYGTGLLPDDAYNAADLLPRGTVPVPYSVQEPEIDDLAANVSSLGAYELPFLTFKGGVSLSVDVSGPVDIDRISVIPNDLRGMAAWVAHKCVVQGGGVGGFITKRIQGLVEFVTDPTTDIDNPDYPASAAFLTLMLSGHEESASFPGDYDPQLAKVLRQAEIDAWAQAGPRQRPVLQERIQKFTRSEMNMRRLGTDVPWWHGWESLHGNQTAVTNFQRMNMTTENLTTARRRRRIAGALR